MKFRWLANLFMSILFASITTNAELANLNVERNELGQLILKGPNCQVINENLTQLKQWKSQLNEISSKKLPVCTCVNNIECSSNITKIVPDFVQLSSLRKPDYYGPNCWNTSLIANKLLAHQRFSTPAEIYFWTHSSFCQELKSSEKLRAGDLITIRDQKLDDQKHPDEVHGFIYVSPELSFSKAGPSTLAAINLQSTNEIFTSFGITDPDCQRVSGVYTGKCAIYANIYRCETFGQHRIKIPEPTTADYTRINGLVDANEASLSRLVMRFRQDLINHQQLNIRLLDLQGTFVALGKESAQILNSIPKNKRDQIEYWSILITKINGSLAQISSF